MDQSRKRTFMECKTHEISAKFYVPTLQELFCSECYVEEKFDK